MAGPKYVISVLILKIDSYGVLVLIFLVFLICSCLLLLLDLLLRSLLLLSSLLLLFTPPPPARAVAQTSPHRPITGHHPAFVHLDIPSASCCTSIPSHSLSIHVSITVFPPTTQLHPHSFTTTQCASPPPSSSCPLRWPRRQLPSAMPDTGDTTRRWPLARRAMPSNLMP